MNSETAAVSRQAHELALKHGAEPDDIEQLCSREALLSILTEANIEADICEDVADTCDLSNLNALSIASGLLDTEQIAQYCFLTKDEAEVVISHCAHKAFHAGVSFGRPAVSAPARLGVFRESPKAADSPRASAFSPKKDGNSSPFGGDSLKFDSPSKRGQKARPAPELTGPKVVTNEAVVASNSSPRRGSVHSHDPFSPKHSSAAASDVFGNVARTGLVPPPSTATEEQVPPTIDVPSEHQPDNLAGTGVSTTSSSAPSTIPTPSLASTRSSVNRVTPLSFEAGDTPTEGTAGSSMPAVSVPTSAAAVAPSPLPVAGERIDFSVPASDLVASAVQPRNMRTEDKNESAGSVPTVRMESSPNSPQTPREATAREMLKVESCQLNTSSTVPPQRDNSIGNAVTSALPSPSAVTPTAVSGARVPELRGVGQPEQFSTASNGYANVPAPPRSAPDFVNGRRSAPVQQETATSRLATGVMSGLPPPLRSPRGRPPPPQMNTNMKSPRATPRPITPPARGRQGRPHTAAAAYPQEGLEELGSTFLKYPGVLPSFMRPTEAHERRLNATDDETGDGARTPSPPHRQARSVNPSARFIRPTACYTAKAATPVVSTPTARPPMTRAHSAAPAAFRGNTPTEFVPFCLHTEMRLPQRNRKTTDEMRVAEAKKAKDAEVLRRRQQLQRLQRMERARTASPKLSEASSARVGRVKPFQLASVMRHEREVQNRKQQLQRQMEDEARAKQFRARQFNPTMFSGVQQPRARRSEPARNSGGRCSFGGGRPVTAPKPPVNRPDQRHSYRQEILEGEFSNDATMARRAMVLAREDEKKQEAAQAARERDFKSKMGPKSVPIFRLDAAKVKPTTIPKPFKLSSSKVVHTIYSEKDRANDQHPPTQLCTPQGVMSEFARSLRAARGEQ